MHHRQSMITLPALLRVLLLPPLFALWPLISMAAITAETLVPPGGNAVFGKTYFGGHVHNADKQRNWPDVPLGSLRLWDTRTGWLHVEPQRGNWQFERLDEFVGWAESRGVKVVLPLGITPRWASVRPNEEGAYGLGTAAEPADLETWRNYVRTVAARYRGRVAAYEISNEATEKNFYSGSIPMMVELVRSASQEIRKIDPLAKTILPSGVGLDQRLEWPAQLLAAGAGPYVDAVAYHLYHGGSPPETLIAPIRRLRSNLAAAGYEKLELWNTESGYWMPNETATWSQWERNWMVSEETAQAYLPRDLLLVRAMGFERFFTYSWDNTKMGMINPQTRKRRPLADVFGQTISMLLRSTLHRCDRDVQGIWQCQLTAANGKRQIAMWLDPSARKAELQIAPPLPGKWMALDGTAVWHAPTASTTAGPVVKLFTEQP